MVILILCSGKKALYRVGHRLTHVILFRNLSVDMGSEDIQCLFCYDEFTEENPKVAENFIGCPCKFAIHEECWAAWDIYECPICHTYIKFEMQYEEIDADYYNIIIENRRREQELVSTKIYICVGIFLLVFFMLKSLI